jgi:hypothetical protein
MRTIQYTDKNLNLMFKTNNVYKDIESFFNQLTAVYDFYDTVVLKRELEDFIFSINIEKINIEELSKQFLDIIEKNCRKVEDA